MKKIVLGLVLSLVCLIGKAQGGGDSVLPGGIWKAITADDSTKLATLVTKANVNECYGNYSVLSHTVRMGAIKCFYMVLGEGADVNKVCNGYVPPLMHAGKYGRLEMVKALVAKGADVHYVYEGDYGPAQGQTPVTYAEMFQQSEVAAYLKSVK